MVEGREEEAAWEDLTVEEFFMAEENFHEGGQDFVAFFKKNEKKNFNWK